MKCSQFLKVGVTRVIGPGGPLDGLLSTRFLLAFVACGLVLVSRGLVLGVITVNYGNNNDISGRDMKTLHVVGFETIQINNTKHLEPYQTKIEPRKGRGRDEDSKKQKLSNILSVFNATNIPDKLSLNEILKFCEDYDFNQCQGIIDSISFPENTRRKRQANSTINLAPCSYSCDGWPYEQCEMEGQFRKATCVNPFMNRSSSVIFSNYPECATVPSGCQRCDDVCSTRDGKRNKLDYISQSSAPRRPPPPFIDSSSSQVCDYKCTKTGGCTVTYVGPPRACPVVASCHAGACFPDEYGGSCSGTPPECQDCNQAISCELMSFYKTDGSPNSVRAVIFLILYVPQLILSLVMVIDVTNKDSWKILLDQPSVILMAVFTHFTCARMNSGCGSTDVRVKVSKFHTILNIIVSVISYIIVFITAHLLLDDEDWGWDLEGMHASILSQLFLAVPFIVMGVATTLGKMNF